MSNIINGSQLMVFMNGKSIAYATSHQLTITGNQVDISHKDLGIWSASEIGNITYEITSENLYSDSGFDDLFTAMVSKNPVTIVFGHASNWNEEGLSDSSTNWTPDTTTKKAYQGKALITSLTANANVGENATFSVTFTGQGSITAVGA